MATQKQIPFDKELTGEEKNLLSEMIDFYFEHKLNADREKVYKYTDYARLAGEISDSGDKYVNNLRVWEIRDSIFKYIEERKTLICNLRNKILR